MVANGPLEPVMQQSQGAEKGFQEVPGSRIPLQGTPIPPGARKGSAGGKVLEPVRFDPSEGCRSWIFRSPSFEDELASIDNTCLAGANHLHGERIPVDQFAGE